MAISLRDVMERPSDVEAMELLMEEYTKYCVGELDKESDVSVEDEDVRGQRELDGLPDIREAFNVRSLSRPEFPRTWIVPKGTVSSSFYENAVADGVTNVALLVDYSHSRCVVNVRSELLRPSAAGTNGLPQKVLAVWPEERSRPHSFFMELHKTQGHGEERLSIASSSMSQDVTSFRTAIAKTEASKNGSSVSGDSALYWPAYVTRVTGVFEDKLFDMSPASHAQLQAYENFEDIIAIALKSPMRLCVDVIFCIDEVSEAHRLTIAPAVRYRNNTAHCHVSGAGAGSANIDFESSRKSTNPSENKKSNGINGCVTPKSYNGHQNGGNSGVRGEKEKEKEEVEEEEEEDPEVVAASKLISRMMKGDAKRHLMVTKVSHCPLLTPDVVPQVISIRNYSYTAVASRRGRGFNHLVNRSASIPQNSEAPSVPQSRASLGGTSNHSRVISSKAKLNKNTLSHSPIALDDIIAGPICQTKQFVFLRPSTLLAAAAQRSAIEDLRVIWLRLRKALVDPPELPTRSSSSSSRSSLSVHVSSSFPTLYASEVQLPRLFATDFVSSWKPALTVQLPDPSLYKNPALKDPSLTLELLRLPAPRRKPRDSTLSEQCVRVLLPALQGHSVGLFVALTECQFPPALPPPQLLETSAHKQRRNNEWSTPGQDESFFVSASFAPLSRAFSPSVSLDFAESRQQSDSVTGLSVLQKKSNHDRDICSSMTGKSSALCETSHALFSKEERSNVCASLFLSNTRHSTSSFQGNSETGMNTSIGTTEHKSKSNGLFAPPLTDAVEHFYAQTRDAAEPQTKRELWIRERRQRRDRAKDISSPLHSFPPRQSSSPSHFSPRQSSSPSHLSPHQSSLPLHLSPHQSSLPLHLSPHQSSLPSHFSPRQSSLPLHFSPHQSSLPSHLSPHQSSLPSHLSPRQSSLPSHFSPHQSSLPSHLSPRGRSAEIFRSFSARAVSPSFLCAPRRVRAIFSSADSTRPSQSSSATATPRGTAGTQQQEEREREKEREIEREREREIEREREKEKEIEREIEREKEREREKEKEREKEREREKEKECVRVDRTFSPLSNGSSSSRRRTSRGRRPYNRLGTFDELLSEPPSARAHAAPRRAERAKKKTNAASESERRTLARGYTFLSWRDASGVEVNVDDPTLLPPSVEAEEREREREKRRHSRYTSSDNDR